MNPRSPDTTWFPSRAAAAAAVLLLTLSSATVQAQPLNNGNFNIELHQGPVLGSTRVIGMAGAYAAIAEEAVGIPFNPVSVANRTHYSVKDFDWDINFTYLTPGLFQGKNFDFDNNRRNFQTDYHIFNYGFLLQYKGFGTGAYVRSQVVTFEDKSDPVKLYSAHLELAQLVFAYAFWKHQIILGGGLRLGYFKLNEEEVDEGERFQLSALGLEAGALFRPLKWPFRIGAAVAVPIKGFIDTRFDEATPQGFYLPKGVVVPLEIRVGAAYCFCFKRRYNPLPGYLKPKRKKRIKHPAPPPPKPRVVIPPPAPGSAPGPTPGSAPGPAPGPAPDAAPSPPPGTGPPETPSPTPENATQPIQQPRGTDPGKPRPPAPAEQKPGPKPREGEQKPGPKPREGEQKPGPRLGRKAPRPGGFYILVAAELVVLGGVKKAIGSDAFFEQIYERTGRGFDVGGRLGVESEVWRHRLRLRAGGYWEPSRFEHYAGRIHGTFGLELRLFDFKLWGPRSLGVSSSVDVAARYSNVSFSLGFWH